MAKKRKKKKKSQSSSGNSKFGFLLILAAILLFVVFYLSNKNSTGRIEIVKPEPKDEIKDQKNVLQAILHSATLLNIPKKFHSPKTRKNDIYLRFPINRDEMDLTFANMLIKGQVELVGGKLITAEASKSGYSQTLNIVDDKNNQKYTIRLYYDFKKKYKKKPVLISIIIDDFGLRDNQLVNKFCKLNKNLTFAIMPSRKHSVDVMKKAHRYGIETMVHMPMEPISYPKNDPGKDAIMINMSDRKIEKTVKKYFDELYYAVGGNNHMGSLATSDKRVMNSLLKVFKEEDKFFIDSKTTASSVGFELAQMNSVKTDSRDIFLDVPDRSIKTMNKHLDRIKKLAKKKKSIIVITHCGTEANYKQLKTFIQKLEENNLKLVPASEIIKAKYPEIL